MFVNPAELQRISSGSPVDLQWIQRAECIGMFGHQLSVIAINHRRKRIAVNRSQSIEATSCLKCISSCALLGHKSAPSPFAVKLSVDRVTGFQFTVRLTALSELSAGSVRQERISALPCALQKLCAFRSGAFGKLHSELLPGSKRHQKARLATRTPRSTVREFASGRWKAFGRASTGPPEGEQL